MAFTADPTHPAQNGERGCTFHRLHGMTTHSPEGITECTLCVGNDRRILGWVCACVGDIRRRKTANTCKTCSPCQVCEKISDEELKSAATYRPDFESIKETFGI